MTSSHCQWNCGARWMDTSSRAFRLSLVWCVYLIVCFSYLNYNFKKKQLILKPIGNKHLKKKHKLIIDLCSAKIGSNLCVAEIRNARLNKKNLKMIEVMSCKNFLKNKFSFLFVLQTVFFAYTLFSFLIFMLIFYIFDFYLRPFVNIVLGFSSL